MSCNWFKIQSTSYGWFMISIGPDLSEASDFPGYDMPRKFLSKVIRVLNGHTEQWLYLMDEPGAFPDKEFEELKAYAFELQKSL